MQSYKKYTLPDPDKVDALREAARKTIVSGARQEQELCKETDCVCVRGGYQL